MLHAGLGSTEAESNDASTFYCRRGHGDLPLAIQGFGDGFGPIAAIPVCNAHQIHGAAMGHFPLGIF